MENFLNSCLEREMKICKEVTAKLINPNFYMKPMDSLKEVNVLHSHTQGSM